MKKNIFNLIILTLLLITIIIKIINNDLFVIYNCYLTNISIVILLFSSIYFTFKLKFLQINIHKLIKNIKQSNSSNYKALFMGMGAKIGVGSIAGVSLAIYIAGPGVLLWIWIINILSSILTYCESYLGIKYKNKNSTGGVFNYIKNGLNNKFLAIIYTLILIFVYSVGFIGIQSNTIVKSITHISNINPLPVIAVLILLVSLIIFNNINNIIEFMTKLVPIMCFLYLLLGLIILINYKENIPNIINLIIQEGISPSSNLLNIIAIGMQRGMFATESGIGTSSIASSISNDKPHIGGTYQLLGTHFITLIIITITGIIVINNNYNHIGPLNGIELILNIFNMHYGTIGSIFLIIIIILFAISTIISGYYYMIRGIKFIKNNLDNLDYFILKITVILLTFLGAIVKSTIIWQIIDTLVLFLLLINIYSLLKLQKNINNNI